MIIEINSISSVRQLNITGGPVLVFWAAIGFMIEAIGASSDLIAALNLILLRFVLWVGQNGTLPKIWVFF